MLSYKRDTKMFNETVIIMIIINKEIIILFYIAEILLKQTDCVDENESVREIIEQESFNRLYWWDVWTNWRFL